MRGTGQHTPPAHTQPLPGIRLGEPGNSSEHVMVQVRVFATSGDMRDGPFLINPEAAREIAAWWQSPGSDGIAFAEFASTGTITAELGSAIDRELARLSVGIITHDSRADDRQALRALRAYVDACPVTVWTIRFTSDAASTIDAPEVVSRTLSQKDAIAAFRDHADEYAETEWSDECECTDSEMCQPCSFRATVASVLRDGDFTSAFQYTRDDVAACPRWTIESAEMAYCAAFPARKATA